jgi:hypothetical protein
LLVANAQDSSRCRKTGLEKEILVNKYDSIVRYYNLRGTIDSALGFSKDHQLRSKRVTQRNIKNLPTYDLWWNPDPKSSSVYITIYNPDDTKNQVWETNLLGDTVYHAYYHYFGPGEKLPERDRKDLHGNFLSRIAPTDSIIFLRWISYRMDTHQPDSSFCLTIISHEKELRSVDEYHADHNGKLNSHYFTTRNKNADEILKKDSASGYRLYRKTGYDTKGREVGEYENYNGTVTVTRNLYSGEKTDSALITRVKGKRKHGLFYHNKTRTEIRLDINGEYSEERTYSKGKLVRHEKYKDGFPLSGVDYHNGKDTLSWYECTYTPEGFLRCRYEYELQKEEEEGPPRPSYKEEHYYYFRKKE